MVHFTLKELIAFGERQPAEKTYDHGGRQCFLGQALDEKYPGQIDTVGYFTFYSYDGQHEIAEAADTFTAERIVAALRLGQFGVATQALKEIVNA